MGHGQPARPHLSVAAHVAGTQHAAEATAPAHDSAGAAHPDGGGGGTRALTSTPALSDTAGAAVPRDDGARRQTGTSGAGRTRGKRRRVRAPTGNNDDDGDEVATAQCGNGSAGGGRTNFGIGWVPPKTPNRNWRAPPVHGLKAPCKLDPAAWRAGLASHPNRAFAAYIEAGIRDGFDTLIDVDEDGPQFNANSTVLTQEHLDHLDKQWATEIDAGRYVPVSRDVHPHLRTQSINCCDKRSYEEGVRKCRTIVNHSKIAGGRASLNCDVQELGLRYIRIDDVTQEIVRRGPDCRICCFDMRHACRQCGKSPLVMHLTGLTWRTPVGTPAPGESQRYAPQTVIDTALEFGGAGAPWTFSTVTAGLGYMCQQDINRALGVDAAGIPRATVFVYLDDVNIVADDHETASEAYDIVMGTWARLGVEFSAEKCLKAQSVAVWLGLLLNTVEATIDLPVDKKQAHLASVRRLHAATSATGAQLESLAGRLGFAHSVHADIRCYVSEAHRLSYSVTRREHQRRLTPRIHIDMRAWELYLEHAPAADMAASRDLRQTPGERWHLAPGQARGTHWLCGDASGGKQDGKSHGGGFFGGDDTGATFHSYRAWTAADRIDLSLTCETNSTFLETLVMSDAVTTWLATTTTSNATLEYWSDNLGLLWNWRKGRSSNTITNDCLRRITLPLLARGITLVVRWAPREETNQSWADCLSHCTVPQGSLATWPQAQKFRTPLSSTELTEASLKGYGDISKRRWRRGA